VTHRARFNATALVAGAAVALLLPLGIGTASGAAPTAKTSARPFTARASALPAHLKTAGSIHALGTLPTKGRVSVMLQLQAKPAVLAYSSAKHLGVAQARTASKQASEAVVSEQRSVASHFSDSATRATTIFKVHALYSGIAVVTDASRLPALAKIPGVQAIHLLTPKTVANANTVPLTGAPQAWEGASGTGTGVTIGIIDTGIDYTHSDFGGPGTVAAYNAALAHSADPPTLPDPTKVAGGYDFAGDSYDPDPNADDFQPLPHPDTNPLDCAGHGSHVAGTAAGYGVNANGTTFHGPYNTSTPFSSLKIGPGMAPGATLYALKVFGCTGTTELASDALDWAADPNGDGDVSDHLDVVNMSLGSDFASPDDPDAVAANNAALAGITVAASMGNSGDAFEVGGSPGSAARVIGVAASDDNTDTWDGVGVAFNGTAAPSSPYAGELSEAYDWTNKPGVTNTPLQEISKTWSDATAEATNSDGCDPLTSSEKAKVKGKVAFLYWTDDDVNRRCGSVQRSANVKAAGAIGALFGNDSNRFAAGISGDPAIPVMITSADARDAIKAALEASTPQAVTVTLTGALRSAIKNVLTGAEDPEDAIASFSSRGVTQEGNVKPDVSAPGVSISSVAMGTGSDAAVESGTSMASPHVAGEAALVVAAHPTWRPEQVKAAIMNTATHPVYPLPAHGGDPLGVLRAGTGRIDAQAAVDTDSLAYVVDDPGEVSVSFGTLDVTAPSATWTKQVRIENDGATSNTYALAVQDIVTEPGADFSVSPTSVTLGAHTSREVTVTLTATRSALNHQPDPDLNLDPTESGGALLRDWASYASSRLVVTPTTGDVLDLSLYGAPRPASAMHAAGTPTLTTGTSIGTGTLTLAGTGLDQGTGTSAEQASVSAFELQAISPRLPVCGSAGSVSLIIGCIPYEDTRSADLRYVGIASDAPAIKAAGLDPFKDPATFGPSDVPSFVYFGITAYAPWRTAQGMQEYDVYIDTDGDGQPDLVTFNDRVTTSGGSPVDVFLATTVSLRDGDGFAIVDQELLDGTDGEFDARKIGSDSMVLPVELNLLAHPDGVDLKGKKLKPFLSAASPRINYSVESYNAEIGLGDVAGEEDFASLLDPNAPFVEPFSFDPTKPGLSAVSGGEPILADDSPGATLTVKLNRSTVGLDGGLGLLLIHHLNADGSRGEVVKVSQDASTTTLAVSPASVGYYASTYATATVSINGNATKPNGGTVHFKDGARVIAVGSLVDGKASVKLPALGVGTHHLTATYVASVSLAASTSAAKTVSVHKSGSTVVLKVSPTKVSHIAHAKATVTVSIPGSAHHPTGTVKVYAGSKLLGTGALVNGKVTLTLPPLSKGSHSLKAFYAATSTVDGGSSASVRVTSI
jgi:subtilisin family serine protease